VTIQYRVGAVGHAMRYHFVDAEDGSDIDISAATVLEVVLRRPDGTTITKPATLVSGGTTGRMEAILDDDFDVSGMWRREGHVETPTLTETTTPVRFLVMPRL
jgi:hypothetical protein